MAEVITVLWLFIAIVGAEQEEEEVGVRVTLAPDGEGKEREDRSMLCYALLWLYCWPS